MNRDQGEAFTFDFDGRTWACKESVPDEVWEAVERAASRSLNRQTRKARIDAAGLLIGAVVVDYSELERRVGGDHEKLMELYDVVPALVSHYQEQREGPS